MDSNYKKVYKWNFDYNPNHKNICNYTLNIIGSQAENGDRLFHLWLNMTEKIINTI